MGTSGSVGVAAPCICTALLLPSETVYRLDEVRKLAESVRFSYQAEHDRVLPEPDGLSAMSDTGAQIFREESFVIFSFIKINNEITLDKSELRLSEERL